MMHDHQTIAPWVRNAGGFMSAIASITDADFAKESSSGPVIIDFWAPWCQPCKQISKELESLATSYPHVRIVKINIDEHPLTARSLNITSIPTIVFFPKSGAPLGVVGMTTAKVMTSKFRLDELVTTR